MGTGQQYTFTVEPPRNYVLVNPVTGERRLTAVGWGEGLRDYLLRKGWLWVNRWAFPGDGEEESCQKSTTS